MVGFAEILFAGVVSIVGLVGDTGLLVATVVVVVVVVVVAVVVVIVVVVVGYFVGSSLGIGFLVGDLAFEFAH